MKLIVLSLCLVFSMSSFATFNIVGQYSQVYVNLDGEEVRGVTVNLNDFFNTKNQVNSYILEQLELLCNDQFVSESKIEVDIYNEFQNKISTFNLTQTCER